MAYLPRTRYYIGNTLAGPTGSLIDTMRLLRYVTWGGGESGRTTAKLGPP